MRKISKILFSVWSLHLILISPFAFAEVLSTTGSFVVYEKDITQYIQDQTNLLLVPNQVIADVVTFDAPFHSSLSQVSWQGNATVNWTKNSSNNIWAFDGQTTNLTLYANTFEVHDTLPISVGGGTINVRIDAVCQNLSMTFPGQWKVHGEIPIAWSGGALVAPLQNVTMTESSQIPVIKISSCQGPTGMQNYLNQQVAQLYANPAKIQAAFITETQEFINSQVAKVMAMIGQPVSFSVLGANVMFTPTVGANLTSGTWILDGPLSLSAPNGTGNKTVPEGYTIASLTDARASGFIFANTFWTEIMGFASRANLLTKQYKSTDIPQFQAFFNNGFEEFFVWDDLFNFPLSQVFNFTFDATAPVNILAQTNMFPGVQWDVAAPVAVEMDAVLKSGVVPYTEFQSNTPAQASLLAQAKNGALNVTYSVTSLDMNYAYRKEFLKIRRPSAYIAMDTIDSNVQSGMQNKVWTYTIPDSASPLPGYRINFQDVIFGTKTFRFEMGIQKK